ncbi:receptor-like protein 50 [Carya illinoinensis]|uniref:receptor-like protein 50 n=1 Tax=Carya illinoinensis TaxID=32201 RepID=UPI001C722F14|nr:receptor-like protein 50 [Carya illinoinensis]
MHGIRKDGEMKEWKVVGKKNIVENKGVGGETLMLTTGDVVGPCGEGLSRQAKEIEGAGGNIAREGLEEGEMMEGPDMGVLGFANVEVINDGSEHGVVGKRSSVDDCNTDGGLLVIEVLEKCGLEQSINVVSSGFRSEQKEGYVSEEPLCHDGERLALLQFKESFIINQSASYYQFAYPKVSSWMLESSSTDCCSWDGVKCNKDTGHISASISAATVFKLSRLTNLNLSASVFSGQIPTEFFELSKLVSLDLSYNSMLKLQKFGLTGEIPSSLGNLTNLNVLQLQKNRLHGSIPQSLSRLASLRILSVSRNHLSGTVELELFVRLKHLSALLLSGNDIALRTKLSSNSTIPKFMALSLGSCNLDEFPDFLRNQDQLELLDLGGNKIHGQVPEWMLNISKETLRALNLRQLSHQF